MMLNDVCWALQAKTSSTSFLAVVAAMAAALAAATQQQQQLQVRSHHHQQQQLDQQCCHQKMKIPWLSLVNFTAVNFMALQNFTLKMTLRCYHSRQ
jgi:hypothetical protein